MQMSLLFLELWHAGNVLRVAPGICQPQSVTTSLDMVSKTHKKWFNYSPFVCDISYFDADHLALCDAMRNMVEK